MSILYTLGETLLSHVMLQQVIKILHNILNLYLLERENYLTEHRLQTLKMT